MDSTKIFHILDLDYPDLEQVKIAYTEDRERDAFIEIKKCFLERKRLSLFVEDTTKMIFAAYKDGDETAEKLIN
ncbi:hypothetical protein WQ54_07675 [Bacillus sp. SA1-12]|uniref:hypothetical protein n=1 Tax=Bacillus sp. SA1-12 TaxID=1455638 RepID=UPI0006255CB5|nr:hypothetical protein [Bacillus sp. SA1-12]KKI92753.1 hypothetical protein WQ54_07675 [Bacillus sp. SA1-12]